MKEQPNLPAYHPLKSAIRAEQSSAWLTQQSLLSAPSSPASPNMYPKELFTPLANFWKIHSLAFILESHLLRYKNNNLPPCHPSGAVGINLFLYGVLKITVEVPRIYHSSQKTPSERGSCLASLSHWWPSRASQGYLAYWSLPASSGNGIHALWWRMQEQLCLSTQQQ